MSFRFNRSKASARRLRTVEAAAEGDQPGGKVNLILVAETSASEADPSRESRQIELLSRILKDRRRWKTMVLSCEF